MFADVKIYSKSFNHDIVQININNMLKWSSNWCLYFNANKCIVLHSGVLGQSCQRYNWQMGRCGSIAFGSSPRRGKTLISNLRCLAEISTCGKDFSR